MLAKVLADELADRDLCRGVPPDRLVRSLPVVGAQGARLAGIFGHCGISSSRSGACVCALARYLGEKHARASVRTPLDLQGKRHSDASERQEPLGRSRGALRVALLTTDCWVPVQGTGGCGQRVRASRML